MNVNAISLRRIQPGESMGFDKWVASRHYRGCVPPGAVARFEFILEKQRLGAMMWGRPCARMLEADADHILELTRMWFDQTKLNGIHISQLLSWARRRLREDFPQVKLLLTYADPEQSHEGTVYIADGWARFEKTANKKSGWANREGRHDACGHSKLRFVRTP